jgi:hypothetical protein
MTLRQTLTALIIASLSACVAAAQERTLTVSAGRIDRSESVVSFPLPRDAALKNWRLRDESGNLLPVQIRGTRAHFILKDLKAGQSRKFALEEVKALTESGVAAQRDGGMIRITIDGKPVLDYQGEKTPLPKGYDAAFQRGGYIHPVFTRSGVAITDDYPAKHRHHHGIWAPWTKTEFEGRTPDFWNMGEKTGTVEFAGFGDTWSGPVLGGFTSKHRFVDLTAKPEAKVVLNETWEVNAYRLGAGAKPYYVFDLALTQETAGRSPLILPQYHYGGLGVRGHAQWDGKENAFFITSEGKDRSNGNKTRGRWGHMGGAIDGKPAGIAILDHPTNFRHPQPMRLHPTEPFFCYAPQQLGDFAIEPGKPYTARYRFLVTDGSADKDLIERAWSDFAQPVEVKVE